MTDLEEGTGSPRSGRHGTARNQGQRAVSRTRNSQGELASLISLASRFLRKAPGFLEDLVERSGVLLSCISLITGSLEARSVFARLTISPQADPWISAGLAPFPSVRRR